MTYRLKERRYKTTVDGEEFKVRFVKTKTLDVDKFVKEFVRLTRG